jgi:hypothetical protein
VAKPALKLIDGASGEVVEGLSSRLSGESSQFLSYASSPPVRDTPEGGTE